ncbi:MAG: hypothetical protein AAFV53_43620, partial [Myxococcota bacterium]
MHPIFIRYHHLLLPERQDGVSLPVDVLGTVMSNLAHYGYGLTAQGLAQLRQTDAAAVAAWWPAVDAALAALTGADREMDAHVVYKNFPAEVLEMSDAEYWIRQILMYWGLPNDRVTQPEAERAPIPEGEPRKIKVLRPVTADTAGLIFEELLANPGRWTNAQWNDVLALLIENQGHVPLHSVPFKENMVQLAAHLMAAGQAAEVGTGTDVLRLAVALSDGDISLRTADRLRSFTRPERRFLLGLLEGCRHLEDDLGRRPERFKRLMRSLRPGDYAARYPAVVAAYDRLYRDDLPVSWAAGVEAGLLASDPAVLTLLQQRPGEFSRRLHDAMLRIGEPAVSAFIEVVDGLSIARLLALRRYLRTANLRLWRTFAPRGNWQRLQVAANPDSRTIPAPWLAALDEALGETLQRRLSAVVPSVTMGPGLERIRLPTNDSDLLPYGRGTAFLLPDGVTFLRTASYWASGTTRGNIWYDNGWNFFTANWTHLGACCWNRTRFKKSAAIFSGDPTNSKDLEGRACQMIDLYLEPLRAAGVRYAVWNILCYNRLSFDDAKEVLASLQWGTEPQAGKLFEPSRVQMSFPLRGANFTKFIAWLDLETNEIVYIDANLKGSVRSAGQNGAILQKQMPAFAEYIETLPSMQDLFEPLPKGDDLYAAYTDEDIRLTA